jgi:hypothetical protein
MAFLDEDDILVAGKDKGTVQRIIDCEKPERPIIDLEVNNQNGRGLVQMSLTVDI